MKLYGYWRSSASYRVRIVLELKGLEVEHVPVNLVKGGQRDPGYLERNPVGLIPALELDDGRVISQSTAIIQWLEENYPEPVLMPADSFERARIMGWVQTVACEMHPLLNIGVLKFLSDPLPVPAEDVNTTWYFQWLRRGFDPLEQTLVAAPYCYGDQLTIADAYLIPQMYNARRFEFDFSPYPKLQSIWEACMNLQAFQRAQPESQADAP